jgi:transposase, IS5 family
VSERRLGQLSFADGVARREGRSEEFLSLVSELVNWAALEAVLRPIGRSRRGAPGYPTVLMLKAVLLQNWYDLSDPALEDALADRLSFRRFVGLALDEAVPDHSTISRFRKALVAHGLTEAVFGEVLRQIEARGLVLRQGTMIDATLVEAAVRRPKKPKPAGSDAAKPVPAKAASAAETGSAGAAVVTPAETGNAGATAVTPTEPAADRPPSKLILSTTDPDARWSKKRGVRSFGYKGHVGVDRRSGIIRRRHFTAGNVADTSVAEALICGDEKAVFADAAYDTHARRAALKARGVSDRIAHRANKHHPLTPRQLARNKVISRRRAGVERVFAIAKHLMGWGRARYRGLQRNAGHFDLLCIAINIRRLTVLTA